MSNDQRTSIKIPKELREKLQAEANKQNRSVHNMIITILLEYFDQKEH